MKWLRTFFYYLTAFAGGALAWGAMYYLYERFFSNLDTIATPTQDFYYTIIAIVPILQNALPQLLAAIALRKLARRLQWNAWWQWLLAGSAVSLAMVYGFSRIGMALETARLPLGWQSLKIALFFAFMGPIMASILPLWVSVGAVAAASLMLWAVEHGIRKAGTKAVAD